MSNLPVPQTEREFLEQILEILEENPHLTNPYGKLSSGYFACFYNAPADSPELTAPHCVIGEWIKRLGYPIEDIEDVLVGAVDAILSLAIPVSNNIAGLAGGVQSIADSRMYEGSKDPQKWGAAAKQIRKVYAPELSKEE